MEGYRDALISGVIGSLTVALTVLFDLVALRMVLGADANFTDPAQLAFEYEVFYRQYDVLLVALSLVLTALLSPFTARELVYRAGFVWGICTAAVIILGAFVPKPDDWLTLVLPYIPATVAAGVAVHASRLG